MTISRARWLETAMTGRLAALVANGSFRNQSGFDGRVVATAYFEPSDRSIAFTISETEAQVGVALPLLRDVLAIAALRELIVFLKDGGNEWDWLTVWFYVDVTPRGSAQLKHIARFRWSDLRAARGGRLSGVEGRTAVEQLTWVDVTNADEYTPPNVPLSSFAPP